MLKKMKKIKELFNKIKEQLLSVSSATWILFVCGAVITAILFGGWCISFNPSYGGGVASLVSTAILACLGTKFNLKETLRIVIGAVVAFLLILFAML